MKLKPEARKKLTGDIQARIAEAGLTCTEIAKATLVDVGQVSRICRGEFKTASFNVMQICNFLGVDLEGSAQRRNAADLHRQRLERGVLAIWDRTPEDADRIVRLLRQIAALRGMKSG